MREGGKAIPVKGGMGGRRIYTRKNDPGDKKDMGTLHPYSRRSKQGAAARKLLGGSGRIRIPTHVVAGRRFWRTTWLMTGER